MIGQTISHFKILEKLGEGGMGVVYKALDLRLERTVALKFLPPHLDVNDETRARFVHEAKAASALDHPNIITIYEINETSDGRTFIAMAYYEGETLRERIARGRIDLPVALDIATQVAEGLVSPPTVSSRSLTLVSPNSSVGPRSLAPERRWAPSRTCPPNRPGVMRWTGAPMCSHLVSFSTNS